MERRGHAREVVVAEEDQARPRCAGSRPPPGRRAGCPSPRPGRAGPARPARRRPAGSRPRSRARRSSRCARPAALDAADRHRLGDEAEVAQAVDVGIGRPPTAARATAGPAPAGAASPACASVISTRESAVILRKWAPSVSSAVTTSTSSSSLPRKTTPSPSILPCSSQNGAVAGLAHLQRRHVGREAVVDRRQRVARRGRYHLRSGDSSQMPTASRTVWCSAIGSPKSEIQSQPSHSANLPPSRRWMASNAVRSMPSG